MTAPRIAAVKEPSPPVRRFNLLTAADLANRTRFTWRIKGILPESGLAAIVGASGSGKTFLALDIAAALDHLLEWFGYRVKANCAVAYLALEGEAGVANRVAAYCVGTGRSFSNRFRVIAEPFSLLSVSDIPDLAESLQEDGVDGGVVIIDTLNRAAAGADENSSVDMGLLISAATELQIRVGGLVLLVHHAGKDASRGARGHSSLFAALDACIEVSRTDDRRMWRVAKSKDSADGETHPFSLRIVELGEDEDGDPITSCVVEPDDAADATVKRANLPSGGNQKVIYDALCDLLRDARHFGMAGAPPTRPCVELEEAIRKTRDRLTVESDRKTERTRSALTGLVNRGALTLREGWLWLS